MGRLLLFGGTTEAREILERGVPAVCCVATEYGAELIKDLPGVEIRVGRLDSGGIEHLIQSEKITCVIDATHPYATEATKNIAMACGRTGTPCLRVSRPETVPTETEKNIRITRVRSCREAAELLNRREGKILLAVGSKELKEFTAVQDYQERIFARVLPMSGVLSACEAMGFPSSHILALQGPFSLEMNRAMLRSTGADFLVTKDGGAPGGMEAKLQAAQEAGAEIILIARPDDDKNKKEQAHSVDEGVLWARRMLNLERPPLFPMLVDLEGKEAVVAGGGKIALRRVRTLLKCGAKIRVISPAFHEDFELEKETEKENGIKFFRRPFEPEDLEGAALAVAASDDREVNRQIGLEARARGIPVSVADAAGECSFFFPALIVSGRAAASVSTGGLSCPMTRRLADRLRAVWEEWVSQEFKKEEQEAGHEA